MSGNNSVKLSNFQVKNFADSSDKVVAWSLVSNSDVITPVSNLFANADLIIKNVTPANSTANVVGGSIWSDGNYIYYAVSNNSIKRAALTSF
jgi:hypothetical protein